MSTGAILLIAFLVFVILYNISARQIDAMAEEIWQREAQKIKQREAEAAAAQAGQAQFINTDDVETQPSSMDAPADDEQRSAEV